MAEIKINTETRLKHNNNNTTDSSAAIFYRDLTLHTASQQVSLINKNNQSIKQSIKRYLCTAPHAASESDIDPSSKFFTAIRTANRIIFQRIFGWLNTFWQICG